MKRIVVTALIVCAALGSKAPAANAGPCSQDILAFEQASRRSAGDPDAGPRAPQSIGAQLDHQPTPALVKEDEARAETGFDAALARAKALDAQGDAACARTLAEAKLLYQLP